MNQKPAATVIALYVFASMPLFGTPPQEIDLPLQRAQRSSMIIPSGQTSAARVVWLEREIQTRVEVRAAESGITVTMFGPHGQVAPLASAPLHGGTYVLQTQAAALAPYFVPLPWVPPQGVHQHVAVFPAMAPGAWTVRVDSQTPRDDAMPVLVEVTQTSRIGHVGGWTEPLVARGRPVVITAALVDLDAGPLAAQATVRVMSSDGAGPLTPLDDDGTNGDAVPGDGLYSALFVPAIEGLHSAVIATASVSSAGDIIRREIIDDLFVAPSGARFDRPAPFSDEPHDSDGDGLFDSIRVAADLNVQTPATYILQLHLVEHASGDPVRVHVEAELTPGSRTMSGLIHVEPWAIPNQGIRYTLTDAFLTMVHDSRIVTVDEMHAPHETWSTATYTPIIIPPRGVHLGDFSTTRFDTDSDGDFDTVRFLADVRVAAGGTYGYSASLYDSCHALIQHIEGDIDLFANLDNQRLELTFSGTAIGHHGMDGPYSLEDLAFWGPAGGLQRRLITTTPDWSVLTFDQGRKCAGPRDRNHNGLCDWCDIASGLSLDRNHNGIPDDRECRPDFDGDGALTPDDLSDFVACYFAESADPGSCPAADFNGDGFTDPDDLADFVAAFFAGCGLQP